MRVLEQRHTNEGLEVSEIERATRCAKVEWRMDISQCHVTFNSEINSEG